ncbi:MAG: hypothetical protein DCF32_14995 [Leptolyngbya sp.]|nr:MAG: hypothetical protein DCF32_14995 [Leptolyngbya sp.]
MTAKDKTVWNDAIALAQAAGDTRDFPHVDDLPLGAVLCTSQLIDCIQMTASLCNAQPTLERLVGDWQPGRYAWPLDKVHAFADPIAWEGQQWIKPAPEFLQLQVEHAIDAW